MATSTRARSLLGTIKRFQPLRRQLRSHYLIEVGGQTIAYCYIRSGCVS